MDRFVFSFYMKVLRCLEMDAKLVKQTTKGNHHGKHDQSEIDHEGDLQYCWGDKPGKDEDKPED